MADAGAHQSVAWRDVVLHHVMAAPPLDDVIAVLASRVDGPTFPPHMTVVGTFHADDDQLR